MLHLLLLLLHRLLALLEHLRIDVDILHVLGKLSLTLLHSILWCSNVLLQISSDPRRCLILTLVEIIVGHSSRHLGHLGHLRHLRRLLLLLLLLLMVELLLLHLRHLLLLLLLKLLLLLLLHKGRWLHAGHTSLLCQLRDLVKRGVHRLVVCFLAV